MIDPITAAGLATSAFNAIKHGISVGRDLQDMGGQLAQWGKAVSDFNYGEEKAKNPPWYTFKGSDSETALMIWNERRKLDEMRKSIKDHISFVYGPSAWEEVLAIEAKMRKQRKDELYRKEELKRQIIEWVAGIVLAASGVAIMAAVIWLVGRSKGHW